MKLLSLFSGIGAFEKALTNIGVDYELVGFSEIDKWAIESYCAIHDVEKELNLGDVSTIDGCGVGCVDIITHGSPCQDFSIIGTKRGGDKGSGTRSSLMWETVRIVSETEPKYVIWENVRGVLNSKNRHNFDKYLKSLEDMGYTNHYKVLNAKHFRVPQNRERIFVVSVRGTTHDNIFKEIKNSDPVFLEDILLKTCPEKFRIPQNFEWMDTPSLQDNVHELYVIGNSVPSKHTAGRIFDIKGIAPTMMYRNAKVIQILDKNNILRKITPLESWRLMGFSDEDFYKAQKTGVSNTQLYKQAGNSIVVPILEEIFKKLLK